MVGFLFWYTVISCVITFISLLVINDCKMTISTFIWLLLLSPIALVVVVLERINKKNKLSKRINNQSDNDKEQ